MGAASSRNEKTTLLPPPTPPPPPQAPTSSYVPGRSTILASSVVFIAAALFLLVEFVCILCGSEALIINILGMLEGAGWLVGFALLIEWQVSHLFPTIGYSRRALAGAVIKLIASVFFNVQPVSWLLAPEAGACTLPGVGVPWSNFVGIWLFHTGNTIDALGMISAIDASRPLLALANLPVVGMWIFWSATWLLVVADTLDYLGTPAPYGPNVSTGVSRTVVSCLQIAGAALLGVGSIVYAYWAHRPTEG